MNLSRFYKTVFIRLKALVFLTGIGVMALVAYFLPDLLYLLPFLLLIYLLILLLDYMLMVYKDPPIIVKSFVPVKQDMGLNNASHWELINLSSTAFTCHIIFSLPDCFEHAVNQKTVFLEAHSSIFIEQNLRPLKRGKFVLVDPDLYIHSKIGFFEKSIIGIQANTFIVLPARKLPGNQQKLSGNSSFVHGNKVSRQKIGHSLEFEQIRDYVPGDDRRDINWQATARSRSLKVNQFMEERSQQIICLLDKGRVMKFSTNGMTLLDFAVNASLMLSEVSLKKGDKVGMISFEKQVDQILLPSRRSGHILNILQYLYALDSSFSEPNYEQLIIEIKRKINQRSLIVLFTSFETNHSLQRNIKYLKLLAKSHLLLVIFFENQELENTIKAETENLEDIYTKTIAKKFSLDKHKIQLELKQYGILSMLTSPNKLTPALINKYLDIKKRNMI